MNKILRFLHSLICAHSWTSKHWTGKVIGDKHEYKWTCEWCGKIKKEMI